MRTGDKGATNTENARNNDDAHGHRPISQVASHTIEQMVEEEQVGHLNGEDGDPAQDLRRDGQMLVDKGMFFDARRCDLLQHDFARAQDQSHVEVHALEHDVDEREGRNERRAAKQ